MNRTMMCNRIGNAYNTSNIEGGEYSYVQAAGSKEKLVQALGYEPKHFKLDIRFEHNGVAVLIETKKKFVRADEAQLREYLAEERALNHTKKIICILANTENDKIRVWKQEMDDAHILKDETVLDSMEHYEGLFETARQNDREAVLKNTYALNETLHRKDIDEKLRSQFVGTALLYIKNTLREQGIDEITADSRQKLKDHWSHLSKEMIRAGIASTLSGLLHASDNKDLKVRLLQKNVIEDQKVEKLGQADWIEILDEIVWNIYRYINDDSSEGQDILNLFFIAFNKYTGKADKNQAFTPDHITNFMCRATGVDRTKRLFDGTCGSGSFLVQGMVMELADCGRQKATEAEKLEMRGKVTREHIFGVEIEEKAFGLATTNMLIHGDGNSNIKKANLFESRDFFRQADPDIILMNPPYNAKPISIPKEYRQGWKADAKEDPTKGMVFLKFISDMVAEMNAERLSKGQPKKEVRTAILLPVAAAIGQNGFISDMKAELLEENTLDAVFTLPNEIFYPGASASACCMVLTLGRPHVMPDGSVPKTFFGYYKEDGHKKKKNLGRIEQFDENGRSVWKQIEEEWLDLYRNRTVLDGRSAMHAVTGDDEWLCEAYMRTDYGSLSGRDFQQSLNDYLAYQMKEGRMNGQQGCPMPDAGAWKEYRLGDLISSIGKSKAINKDELIPAADAGDSIRYITRTAENNGCEMLASRSGLPEDIIEKGNAISIGDTTATCFYQDEDFITGDHMVVIRADGWLNERTGLFVATLLRREQYKYSYGRAYLMSRIMDTMIKLPAKPDGTPDWQAAEDYIGTLPHGDRLAKRRGAGYDHANGMPAAGKDGQS